MAKWKNFGLSFLVSVCILLSAGWAAAEQQVSVTPAYREVVEGQEALFKCEATEAEGHSVTWLKAEADTDKLANHIHMETNAVSLDRVAATLLIKAAKRSDAGRYLCVVRPEDSRDIVARQDVRLNVLFLDKKFRSPPQSVQLAGVGRTATFLCVPPEGNPPARVTWRKDRQNLAVGEKFSIGNDNSLTVTDVQLSDSAWYTCVAQNKVGHRRATVRLTVYDVPKFVTRPVDQQVSLGKNFTLECRCDAMAMTLFWKKIGGDLPSGRFQLVDGGNLVIYDAQPSDTGDYVCTVNSPAGDISAIAKVEVIEEPADAIIVPESIVEGSGLVADPVEGGAKIKRPLPPLDEGSGEDRPLPPPSAEGSGEETSALL